MSRTGKLPLAVVLLMLFCTTAWGANVVAIKLSTTGMPPIMTAGIRNAAAGMLVALYIFMRKGTLFHRDKRFWHGVGLGGVFALNFLCLYLGTSLTDASRAVVLLYTQPLFVALRAHFLLRGDRLTPLKAVGLTLAFLGVAAVFMGRGAGSSGSLEGDLLMLSTAVVWALNTVYAKWALTEYDLAPRNALLYQLVFSAPLLLGAGWLLEGDRAWDLTASVVSAVGFQIVVVAAISYLVWFELIERHPASVLSSFLLLTPPLGVLAGWAVLGEHVDLFLALGLGLILGGLSLVSRTPPPGGSGSPLSPSVPQHGPPVRGLEMLVGELEPRSEG